MLTQTAAILIEQQQKLYYALMMVTQKLDSEMRRMAGLTQCNLLTRRQEEVLALVRARRSNKEIGHQLHIAENTVKYHLTAILAKFGAQNRTDLILSTGDTK